MSEHTRPDRETREAERDEAKAEHEADREPTRDEEKAADELELDPEVAESYEDATERGAKQEGEGRIP